VKPIQEVCKTRENESKDFFSNFLVLTCTDAGAGFVVKQHAALKTETPTPKGCGELLQDNVVSAVPGF